MKLKNLLFIPFLGALSLQATNYTIVIDGLGYSPATVVVQPNDVVSIEASGAHPLVQVSSATWLAGGNTELPGGWGVKTATYQFTVPTGDTIFYVCQNHSSQQMKGMIIIDATNKVKPVVAQSSILFANPVAQGQVSFLNNGNTDLVMHVYNLNGQLQGTAKIEAGSTEIQWMVPGMYSVIFRNSEEEVIRKEKLLVQ